MHSPEMIAEQKIDKARGRRVKFIREEILKFSSQDGLAAALSQIGEKVTRGAVGNWEQGKAIGIKNMVAICRLSGANLEWLASNIGFAPTGKTVPADAGSIWLHQLRSAVETAQAEGASSYQIHEAFENLVPLALKRKLQLLAELDPAALRSLGEVVAEDERQSNKTGGEGKEGSRQ